MEGTVGFRIGGQALSWDAGKQQLSLGDVAAPLPLENGRLRLQVFVDRGSIEVFGNDGQVALSVGSLSPGGKRAVEAFATKGQARLVQVELHTLKSIWE